MMPFTLGYRGSVAPAVTVTSAGRAHATSS